jgi:hypothetical protein
MKIVMKFSLAFPRLIQIIFPPFLFITPPSEFSRNNNRPSISPVETYRKNYSVSFILIFKFYVIGGKQAILTWIVAIVSIKSICLQSPGESIFDHLLPS